MKKRFFSSFLALLFILLITSCAGAYNDYKEKNTGSVSFNVGQIVESALRASRSVTREGIAEGDDGPVTENPKEDFIEPWDCISSSVLKINVETKGDYQTSVKKDLAFDYLKYMGFVVENPEEPITSDEKPVEENYLETLFKDEYIELKIPLNKTISIDMTVNLDINWIEDKLQQLYEQRIEEMIENDASDEEIAKLTWDVFVEEIELRFNGEMGIHFKGTSDEITIHEGENPVTIKLEVVPYNGHGEKEGKYYLCYLQLPLTAAVTYTDPVKFADYYFDDEGARLQEFCYINETSGYFKNTEKSDQNWKTDADGNQYMEIYFDYNEEAIFEGIYQANGLDDLENSYTIILYNNKNLPDSGIYMLMDNSSKIRVSYGEWSDITGSDAKTSAYEFTETLYLNNNYGLSFANDNTFTDLDNNDGFRFKSANGKEINFEMFELYSGEEIEVTQYYNIYLQDPGSENYIAPVQLPYNPDAAGAELKEYEYRNCNIYGWYYLNEDDWITTDNLKYKNVYYSYDETQSMSISHQTPAIVDGKETYELSMYALNSNPGKGIYFIDKTGTNNTGYSYGTWESTGVADVSLSSLKFTEELAYNTTNNCIGFAENVTAQTVDASNEFTLTSANGLTFSFATLETNTSVNGSGTITPNLPGKFEILEAVSAGINYFLNKGKIQFSLIDSTNEVPVDASNVDWDYELRCGRTIIPDDGTYYTHEIPGTLEFINLPASGTYRLYVEVTPYNSAYENYEMASYVSEYNITAAYYEYNVSDPTADNYLNIDDYETDPAFEALAAAMSKSNVYLKLSGQVGTSYGNNLYHIKDICNPSYTLYLDIENFTAEEAANTMNYGVFDDWTRLTGITLPAVVTALECNDSSEHYSIFYNCPELQTVKFPNPQNWYVSSYRLAEGDLLNVDWDEELTQINVYNQETNAENLTSNWGYLYQRTE